MKLGMFAVVASLGSVVLLAAPSLPGGGKDTPVTSGFDLVKVEETKGVVTQVRLKAFNKVEKDHPVLNTTKFIFDDGKKTRELDAKTVLSDEAAKKWLQPGKFVHATIREGKASLVSIRFGPPIELFRDKDKEPVK